MKRRRRKRRKRRKKPRMRRHRKGKTYLLKTFTPRTLTFVYLLSSGLGLC